MSFEISFIRQNISKFFSAEADSRKLNNRIATMSNWKYSTLIDVTIPAIPQNRMLSQLVDYTMAPPKDAIKPFGIDFQCRHYTTAAYTYGSKSCPTTQSLSCATYAIYILCY